jgi:uncharacterized protein
MNILNPFSLDVWPVEWHPIVHEVIDGFKLDINDIHGIHHWSRVLVNGMRLAKKTGANHKVLIAFALLHDCQRENDGRDPEHGLRGAQHGKLIRAQMPSMSDVEFDLFFDAAERHTQGRVDADITVQTCWDADRLDLFRVGIYPDPLRLCTEAARRADVIEWAVDRSNSYRILAAD